jgi:hypothetical protein
MVEYQDHHSITYTLPTGLGLNSEKLLLAYYLRI